MKGVRKYNVVVVDGVDGVDGVEEADTMFGKTETVVRR